MGIGKSREQPPEPVSTPRTVRIGKEDIPEEYRKVGVSTEVIKRVLNKAGDTAEIDALKEELWEARRHNDELLDQLRKSNEKGAPFAVAGGISVEDLEERRKAFNEAIERVEKQFCSFRRENACESNEKEMMECLRNNKKQVLNCLPLMNSYEQCVAAFRKQVLNEAKAS